MARELAAARDALATLAPGTRASPDSTSAVTTLVTAALDMIDGQGRLVREGGRAAGASDGCLCKHRFSCCPSCCTLLTLRLLLTPATPDSGRD